MTTTLSTRVVKINFKRIIDNALDREWWGKKWLIFEYDNFELWLSLSSIYTEIGLLQFKISIRKETEEVFYEDYEFISLYLDNYNERVLRKTMLSKAHTLVRYCESEIAINTEEYKMLIQQEEDSLEESRAQATEFLDENGIEIEDVREAYIQANTFKKDLTSVYVDSLLNNALIHVHNMVDIMIKFEGEENE